MTGTDIITLDNLGEKIPKWSPNDACHLYAIVDMGSNGIRFSITSLAPPNTRLLAPIFSTRAGTSLFDALTSSPSGTDFPLETITTVASTLSHFHHLACVHGVPQENIIIMATEAMRRASNAAQMLDAIATATNGLGVHILDPSVETLLGAIMGSRSGFGHLPSGGLFLDLGGGSVQITWVDPSKDDYEVEAAKAGVSMPFGAARFIKVLTSDDGEVRSAEISKLQTSMQDAYAKLCSRFPALQGIKRAHESGQNAKVNVYMCGGGFRGYGSMLMHNDEISPYPISSIHSYTVPSSLFKQTAEMRRVNEEYEGKIFGLSKRRRQQFSAIATVVEAFIEAIPNIGRVTFCGGSNREGVLMMKLPLEIREGNPLEHLSSTILGDGKVVSAIALKLRDALPNGVNLDNIPNILTSGLSHLFIREAWSRQGHDDDVNTSFWLHYAAVRDSNAPGLSHVARAMLALGMVSRWGGGLGPADAQLYSNLNHVLQREHLDAPFWAIYLGAVIGVLVEALPVFPSNASTFDQAIKIKSRLKERNDKKDKVIVTIGIDSDNMRGINLENLVDKLEGAAKKYGGQKPNFKVSAQISLLS